MRLNIVYFCEEITYFLDDKQIHEMLRRKEIQLFSEASCLLSFFTRALNPPGNDSISLSHFQQFNQEPTLSQDALVRFGLSKRTFFSQEIVSGTSCLGGMSIAAESSDHHAVRRLLPRSFLYFLAFNYLCFTAHQSVTTTSALPAAP